MPVTPDAAVASATSTATTSTLGKRKPKRIASEEKEIAYFLVFDARMHVSTAAVITDVRLDTLTKSIGRERKRRKLKPPVRSPEDIARIQARVDRLWAALETEHKWRQKQRGSTE